MVPFHCQDVDLYKIFAPFGAIAPKGVKAMQYPDGTCQGWGHGPQRLFLLAESRELHGFKMIFDARFVNYVDPMSVKAASDLLNGT